MACTNCRRYIKNIFQITVTNLKSFLCTCICKANITSRGEMMFRTKNVQTESSRTKNLGPCLVIGSHGDPQVCRFVEGNIIWINCTFTFETSCSRLWLWPTYVASWSWHKADIVCFLLSQHIHGCPLRLPPNLKGEGINKSKPWKTTSFGHSIMWNQHCNGWCNHLRSAASFVQNQRQ